MTPPQDLADRLEREIDGCLALGNVAILGRWLVDTAPEILAALRSASASGEGMREAVLAECEKIIDAQLKGASEHSTELNMWKSQNHAYQSACSHIASKIAALRTPSGVPVK
jgi:hypothetical protein